MEPNVSPCVFTHMEVSSVAEARLWFQHRAQWKLNPNGPIEYSTTNIFPLRKRQVLKSPHCSSKEGKLIKAVLRRAAGLVKPVKCKLHLTVTLPALLFFNLGLCTLVSKALHRYATEWNCSSQHDQAHWEWVIYIYVIILWFYFMLCRCERSLP